MPVEFPTGKHPGWELDGSDDEPEPATVLQSCVVLQSLRQSRDQWMYSIFPRFSGRVRGKPDLVPPPHTLLFRGRCQIEIGPHIFQETSFYEAQYLPPAPPQTPSFIQSTWQSSPHPGYAPYGYGYQTTPTASQPLAVQHTASPLLSSLTSMSSVTPALINQVNAAAASSPTLSNLLQLAAAGKGNAEQLKTLGILIQSLATAESPETAAANLMQSSAQPSPSVAPTTVKEFDLVLQYHETSYEKWILPRGPVICEKVADKRSSDLSYDIVLTMALQPPTAAQKLIRSVVTIRLKCPPPAVWETIWRWVGGEEKINENRGNFGPAQGMGGTTFKQTERVYLAHRIPEGSLLTAIAKRYVMKSIKPGPIVVPKPKRKPAQRKPTQTTPAVQSQTAPQASGSAATAPIPSTSSLGPATPSPAPRPSTSAQPEPKRRKVAKPKPVIPYARNSLHVPLILGGRFCRPCVDSGKATTVYVPYYAPQQYTPVYAQPQQNIPVAPVYAQPAASRPSGPESRSPSARITRRTTIRFYYIQYN
ncbi:hypothetical protein DFH06DRAFT_1207994 [Mycena polygramma]|nr:hypothetical protein DFH06DRAFT_1207994 [Mycena polygramma]